jgi:antitoxin component HigA of HigAB toxin-antitoxin module
MEAIGTHEEYEAAMARLDELFDLEQLSKDEQREFNRLAELIDAFEQEHWPSDDED